MNKKILVYYSQLNMGGAEKSLIRLMNTLAKDGNEVTCLCRYGNGSCEYLLDERIKRYSLSAYAPVKSIGFASLIKNGRLILQRLIALLKLKLSGKEYDIAFVGLQGLSAKIICRYVRAKKRAIFIRTDVSTSKAKNRILNSLKEFERELDYFICVAGTVRDSLVREIPDTEPKARVIYNMLDLPEMQRNLQIAENPFASEKEEVQKIVTVCRISDASKGIFRMVHICRKLKEEGCSFRWFVVGDGPDLVQLRNEIESNDLTDVLFAVGRVENPFGYYKNCDLVAVLSYYEGLCGIVNEAKIAGKAVIATEVSGIHEQLEHGVNGWIVENEEEAILDGMRYMLTNPNVVQKMTNGIYPQEILDDTMKLQKIYDLME